MHLTGITITAAHSTEAALLTALSEQTFRETFASTNTAADMDKYIGEEMHIDKITAELQDPKNMFFIAWRDSLPAGYMKLSVSDQPDGLQGSSSIELARIYVLKAFQHMKVGALLLQYCLSLAAAQGYEAVWLGVWEHNEHAIGFYKRFGFAFFGSHIFRLGDDDQTDLLMKKHL